MRNRPCGSQIGCSDGDIDDRHDGHRDRDAGPHPRPAIEGCRRAAGVKKRRRVGQDGGGVGEDREEAHIEDDRLAEVPAACHRRGHRDRELQHEARQSDREASDGEPASHLLRRFRRKLRRRSSSGSRRRRCGRRAARPSAARRPRRGTNFPAPARRAAACRHSCWPAPAGSAAGR